MIDLRPLTQDERQAAFEAAKAAVIRAIGPKPDREMFAHHTAGKYPPKMTRLITILCLVLLLAAFTPSAMRLFVIGYDTFGQAINKTAAKTLAGVAAVLSAEIGQVVFSLALATFGTTKSARRLLYTSMMVATTIALVGNIQKALPGHTHSPFAWLEAVVPPLLTLSTAYVLKEQMLDSIYQRYENEQAYQTALADWLNASAAPESHPRWLQYRANAIRDALRRANARRKETMESLTVADWRALVQREFQADEWYAEPVSAAIPVPLLHKNGNGNGHYAGIGN